MPSKLLGNVSSSLYVNDDSFLGSLSEVGEVGSEDLKNSSIEVKLTVGWILIFAILDKTSATAPSLLGMC